MNIRSKYKEYGVKNFYQWHYDQYKNPHEQIIKKSIIFGLQNEILIDKVRTRLYNNIFFN